MRHAIYYAPSPGSQLHRLGSEWLGRDAVTGQFMKQPALEGLREATASPRRYGLHATLKPPFALKPGCTRAELGDAVALVAAHMDTPTSIRLVVCEIDGFIALTPEGDDGCFAAVAARCVRELDWFRAPVEDAELARRRAASLTARQERNLREWGYPYVLGEYPIHLTLTRRLAQSERQRFFAAAQSHFAPVLRQPCALDALTIFTELLPGADFRADERFPLRPPYLLNVAL